MVTVSGTFEMGHYRRAMVIAVVLAGACDQGAKRSAAQTGSAGSAAPAPASPPASLTWLTDETAAFTQARAAGKAVVIDFTAQWAAASTELDLLLADPQIAALLAPQFVPLRIDVTEESDATAQIRDRYQASSVPFLRFVDTDGTILATITSLPSPDELRGTIERAIAQRRPQPSGSGAAVRPITACPVPDQRQISEALRVQRGAVATCVEQAIAKTSASSVPARIDATFEVDERGTVITASVASAGTTVDHELATCLTDVLLALRFAARNCPGSVTIRYPLFLEPAG